MYTKHLLFLMFLYVGLTEGERFTLGRTFSMGHAYSIIFKELQKCPSEGKRLMYYEMDGIKTINRTTRVVHGRLVLREGLHNGLWGRLSIAAKSGGSWIENFFVTKGGPLCKAAKNMVPQLFQRILKSIGYSSCPVPPGNYTFKDLDLAPDFQLPMIPLNKYKVNALIAKNGTRIGCAQIIVDVVEKKKN